MKRVYLTVLVVCCAFSFIIPAYGVVITVPGTSDPWLAGEPDGTSASFGDTAPAQSPVLVTGISGKEWVEVSNVSGLVNYVSGGGGYSPDGGTGDIINHMTGAELSKSDIWAPTCSLLGVFLDDMIPSGFSPPQLVFGSQAAMDYLTISPKLNQVFFIGDGLTSTNIQQRIFVPEGATRLFLGTMDGYGWYDNSGAFTLDLTVPEPATLCLLGLGALGLIRRKKQENQV
jgi:PEP-CTERM motif